MRFIMGLDIGFFQGLLSNHTIDYFCFLASFLLTIWLGYKVGAHMYYKRKTRAKVKRFIQTRWEIMSIVGSGLTSTIEQQIGIDINKLLCCKLLFMKTFIHKIFRVASTSTIWGYNQALPLLDWGTRLCIQSRRYHNKHYAMHRKTRKNKFQRRRLLLFMAMTKAQGDSRVRQTPLRCRFDVGSFPIGLDQHSSRCISNQKEHFIDLKPARYKDIMGTGGNATIGGEGTLRWRIEDDHGEVHIFLIPQSLYVPSSPKCLLSPQHFAQVGPDEHRHTTGCDQQWDRAILRWGPEGMYRRTVMNSSETNTPNISSAPDIESYLAHVHDTDGNDDFYQTNVECCQSIAHLIPDDESSVASSHMQQYNHTSNENIISPNQVNDEMNGITTVYQPSDKDNSEYQEENMTQFVTTDEGLQRDQVHVIETDEESLSANTPYAELLRWHYRLGHISFSKLKAMARLGIIPKRLANVEHIKCRACQFGKLTRKPWRNKGQQPRRILPATKPGQCISVDQMESSTIGFVAQLKGRLTKRRYRVATIFVDHFSDLSYVHLQSSTSSEETVQAKAAFEAYARDHGVTIKHYHADNGRFADNGHLIVVIFLGAGQKAKTVRENKQLNVRVLARELSCTLANKSSLNRIQLLILLIQINKLFSYITSSFPKLPYLALISRDTSPQHLNLLHYSPSLDPISIAILFCIIEYQRSFCVPLVNSLSHIANFNFAFFRFISIILAYDHP